MRERDCPNIGGLVEERKRIGEGERREEDSDREKKVKVAKVQESSRKIEQ